MFHSVPQVWGREPLPGQPSEGNVLLWVWWLFTLWLFESFSHFQNDSFCPYLTKSDRNHKPARLSVSLWKCPDFFPFSLWVILLILYFILFLFLTHTTVSLSLTHRHSADRLPVYLQFVSGGRPLLHCHQLCGNSRRGTLHWKDFTVQNIYIFFFLWSHGQLGVSEQRLTVFFYLQTQQTLKWSNSKIIWLTCSWTSDVTVINSFVFFINLFSNSELNRGNNTALRGFTKDAFLKCIYYVPFYKM